jgi:hypothetical protein
MRVKRLNAVNQATRLDKIHRLNTDKSINSKDLK